MSKQQLYKVAVRLWGLYPLLYVNQPLNMLDFDQFKYKQDVKFFTGCVLTDFMRIVNQDKIDN